MGAAWRGLSRNLLSRIKSMNVDAVYSVLKGDKVSVKNVDNTTLSLITGNNLPRLSFAGFAVQKRDVNDAVAGWIALKTRYPNLK